jgi:hypothetical protein
MNGLFTRQQFTCRKCGYRWNQCSSEIFPKLCANKHCHSRLWNREPFTTGRPRTLPEPTPRQCARCEAVFTPADRRRQERIRFCSSRCQRLANMESGNEQRRTKARHERTHCE